MSGSGETGYGAEGDADTLRQKDRVMTKLRRMDVSMPKVQLADAGNLSGYKRRHRARIHPLCAHFLCPNTRN